MRAALAARGYRPRNALQAAAVGRVATALFLRTLRARRARLPGDARARLHGAMPRLDAARFGRADVALRRRARCAVAAAPCRSESPHELRDPRPRARATATRTAARARTASTCTSRHGERVAVLGPNGAGKTTLDAPPQRPAHGRGRARGRRARRQPATPCATCARASASSSRTPTTSSSCRPCARTSPSARSTWGSTATTALRRVDEALAAVRMGERRRPRAAPALDGRAPAGGDRHRAGDATRPARARRALRQPRPARAARAARGAGARSSARCSS